MPLSIAAVIYGESPMYYDHLAPLCAYLNIPLVVTEHATYDHLQKLYPSLVLYYFDTPSAGYELVKRFDAVISCSLRTIIKQTLSIPEQIARKKCPTIWTPHGNSDKGAHYPMMEAIQDEALINVYGQKMLDFIREKGAIDQLVGYTILGNYRKEVYVQFKPHHLKILKEDYGIEKTQKTILYAPTWDDGESDFSFFKVLPHLLRNKPRGITLLIKPHPNIYKRHCIEMEKVHATVEPMQEIHIIKEFTPIYPLIDMADIYLGDMSSVGYDFLTYNKPMYFIRTQRSVDLPLFACGESIYPENYEALYEIMESPQIEKKKARHDLYEYTFGAPRSADMMYASLCDTIQRFKKTL